MPSTALLSQPTDFVTVMLKDIYYNLLFATLRFTLLDAWSSPLYFIKRHSFSVRLCLLHSAVNKLFSISSNLLLLLSLLSFGFFAKYSFPSPPPLPLNALRQPRSGVRSGPSPASSRSNIAQRPSGAVHTEAIFGSGARPAPKVHMAYLRGSPLASPFPFHLPFFPSPFSSPPLSAILISRAYEPVSPDNTNKSITLFCAIGV